MNCPKCGSANKPDARFCATCGTAFAAAPPPQQPQQPPQQQQQPQPPQQRPPQPPQPPQQQPQPPAAQMPPPPFPPAAPAAPAGFAPAPAARTVFSPGLYRTMIVVIFLIIISAINMQEIRGFFSQMFYNHAASGSYSAGWWSPGYLVKASAGERFVWSMKEAIPAITVATFFLIWIYNASRNMRSLGVTAKYGPGWAVGWWFIPVANLFMPFLVMREIWNESDPAAGPGMPPVKRSAPGALLPLWWAFYIGSGVINGIAGELQGFKSTYKAGMVFELFSRAAYITAAVMLILIIKTIYSWQKEKAEAMSLE